MKFSLFSFFMLSLSLLASAAPNDFALRGSSVADAKRWNHKPVKHVGKITVKNTKGECIGFIASTLNANGQYTIDLKESHAATVCFDAPNVGKSSALSFDDQTSKSPNASFVGAVVQRGTVLVPQKNKHGKWTMRVVTTNWVSITGTAESGAGTGPQPGPNTITGAPTTKRTEPTDLWVSSSYDGESSIWGYNPETQSVAVKWTNYDGSEIETTPFFRNETVGQSTLDMVSDTETYKSAHPHAIQISLHFLE